MAVIFIGLVVLGLLVRFVIEKKEIFIKLHTMDFSDVLFCLAITVCAILCTSLIDRCLAEILEVKIGYVDCIGTTFVAAAVNIVLPMSMGSIIRAQYLKKRCNLSYSKFISVTAGAAVLQIFITLLEALLSLLLAAIFMKTDKRVVLIVAILFIGALGGIYVTSRYQKWFLKWLPFKKFTEPIFKSFFELISAKKVMLTCTVLYIINTMLMATRFYFIFKILGSQVSILNSILYQSVYTVSGLVYILPGNIGIGEMLIGITNSFLGSDFDMGVAVTLINRVIYYITCIGGGMVFAIPVYKRYVNVNLE